MRRPRHWQGGRSIYSLVMRQTARLQVASIALGLLVPPLAIVPLTVQQRIIDDAIPATDIALAFTLTGLLAGAVALSAALRGLIYYLQGWIVEIVTRILRISLVAAQRRRPARRARAELGAVTSVLAAEVEPLGDFAAEAINTPLIQGGTLVSVFGYMFYTEPTLAAIGLAALVAEAIVTPVLQHFINLLTAQRIIRLRRAGHDLIEAVRPGRHGALIPGLSEIRASYRLRLRMNALKAVLKIARHVIDRAATVAVLGLGAVMVMRGQTELGVVVAFLSALRQIQGPWSEFWTSTAAWRMRRSSTGSCDRRSLRQRRPVWPMWPPSASPVGTDRKGGGFAGPDENRDRRLRDAVRHRRAARRRHHLRLADRRPEPHQRLRTALTGVAIAAVILLAFAFFGEAMLDLFGISLPALRIAGGILLLLIAIDMVFGRPSGATSTTPDEAAEAMTSTDISVFPLATPLIAGPGAMGAVILMMAAAGGDPLRGAVIIGAIVAILALCLVSMLLASQLQRLLGRTGVHVVGRVFGVILAALSVQFMLDGLAQAGLLPAPS